MASLERSSSSSLVKKLNEMENQHLLIVLNNACTFSACTIKRDGTTIRRIYMPISDHDSQIKRKIQRCIIASLYSSHVRNYSRILVYGDCAQEWKKRKAIQSLVEFIPLIISPNSFSNMRFLPRVNLYTRLARENERAPYCSRLSFSLSLIPNSTQTRIYSVYDKLGGLRWNDT